MATLAALVLLSGLGCARSGKFLALNPRRSSLREQLSRLEFQNQQLQDELKVAQEESRKLSSDLRLAEIDRQDMERRLESYRTQLGLGGSSNPYEMARPSPGEEAPDSRATRPASRPPSATPFTRIPNPAAIDVTPPPGPSAEDTFDFSSGPGRSSSSSSFENRQRPYIEPPPVQYFDLSPSSRRSDLNLGVRGAGSTWSPLARGGS